ncbi:hypothetical protein FPQ18DRAFT_134696 [Pyronema domesticum]|nr:hypothetical protein FPQ18DRAFT_134696 [Pyronema domesticum]
MGDPFSVAASVVGILGFTAQTMKVLEDYVGSVKDAPAEARTLRTEVAAIQSVLDNLGVF